MKSDKWIDIIVGATFRMAEMKTGAQIVVLGQDELKEVIQTGDPVHAVLSVELLMAICSPWQPLADGAVVVRGNEIVAAGCLMPDRGGSGAVLEFMGYWKRTKAVTEASDCTVIWVSEETGVVSLFRGGAFRREVTPDVLKIVLMGMSNKHGGSGS